MKLSRGITQKPTTAAVDRASLKIADDSQSASTSQVLADAIKFTYVSSATAPGMVAQPQNQTATQGASATFTATANGTPPLSYQWRFNGTNISGATNSSHTLFSVQTGDDGSYSVAITNVAGNIVSSNAVLKVNSPKL